MTNSQSSEETAVLAIYSTRRDAEVAKEYLDDAGIETFVRADDAGGMHPQLQRPHGVKLIGMSSAVQDAHEVLKEADLLPQPVEESEELDRDRERADFTFSLSGVAGFLAVAAVILALLYMALSW